MKNCICCESSYAPYKIGNETEISGLWCEISVVDKDGKMLEANGLCGFCNPKSVLFNHKPSHSKSTCRV